MLIAALGCNLVWGIIDAGMYLMARLGERGHNAVVAQAIRKAADREQALRIIAAELPRIQFWKFLTVFFMPHFVSGGVVSRTKRLRCLVKST